MKRFRLHLEKSVVLGSTRSDLGKARGLTKITNRCCKGKKTEGLSDQEKSWRKLRKANGPSNNLRKKKKKNYVTSQIRNTKTLRTNRNGQTVSKGKELVLKMRGSTTVGTCMHKRGSRPRVKGASSGGQEKHQTRMGKGSQKNSQTTLSPEELPKEQATASPGGPSTRLSNSHRTKGSKTWRGAKGPDLKKKKVGKQRQPK